MKVKIKILLCLLFVLNLNVNGQWSFNHIYNGNDSPEMNNFILENDTVNSLSYHNYTRLNASGDTISNVLFQFSFPSSCNELNPDAYPINYHNKKLVVVANSRDSTCAGYWCNIALFNSVNNLKLWEKKFLIDSFADVPFASFNNDSEIYIAGKVYNTTYPYFIYTAPIYFLKFDTNGNLLWNKYFNNILGAPVSIIKTTDGGSILGMNIKDIGATLMKLDNAGNVLWCKSYYRNKSMLIKVIEGENSNIYLTGIKDTTLATASYDNSSSFLIKADSNGFPLWGVYYSQPDSLTYITDLLFNHSLNKLISVGSHGNTTYGGAYFTTFDVNPFPQNATTFYIRNNYTLSTNCIVNIDSNNYLIGGRASNFSTFGGYWLFTADINGYGICNGFPGTINYNSFTPVDSDITVTYTTGATVVASNDIYTVGAQPFNVIDGCMYTGEQTISTANNLLQITPNPADDVFTVSLPATAKHASSLTLSVYDAQGKRVQQQQVKNGDEKVNVNMKGQRSGIYNVVISTGAAKYSGKIVLQ